jgi:hypothetical protein
MLIHRLASILAVCFLTLSLSACVVIEDGGDNNGGGGNNGGSGSTESGVSSDKQASDFTTEDKQSFCDWLAQEKPPVGTTIDCGNGNTLTSEPYTDAQCESDLNQYPNCPADKLEACYRVIVSDPCTIYSETIPSACQGLENCTDTSDDTGITSNNSNDSFCYDHTCNDNTTGKKCFATEAEYCDSLCQETNCVSVDACAAECM